MTNLSAAVALGKLLANAIRVPNKAGPAPIVFHTVFIYVLYILGVNCLFVWIRSAAYYFFLFLITSRKTAAMMMAPLTICCVNGDTPARLSILANTARMAAPTI